MIKEIRKNGVPCTRSFTLWKGVTKYPLDRRVGGLHIGRADYENQKYPFPDQKWNVLLAINLMIYWVN